MSELFYDTLAIETWVATIMSVILILVAATSLFFVSQQKGQSNQPLVILDLLLILNSILQVVVILDPNAMWPFHSIYYGAYASTALLAHWVVCFVYLRVSFETRALLNKNAFNDGEGIFQRVESTTEKLYVANAWVIVYSIALGIGYTLSLKWSKNWFYILIGYIFGATVAAFLIAWAIALLQLSQQIKQCNGLIPNQKLFNFHRVTVFASVLFIFLEYTTYTVSKEWTDTPNMTFAALTNVIATLNVLAVVPSFWIAIYVMTPSKFGAAEDRRSAFRTFLRGGFDDFAKLQAAIIEENHDLTDEQKEDLRKQMARYDRLSETGLTLTLMSDLTIVDKQMLPFRGQFRFNPKTFDQSQPSVDHESELRLTDPPNTSGEVSKQLLKSSETV